MKIEQWVDVIDMKVREELSKQSHADGSHDFGHFVRVSSLAREFVKEEGGNELVAHAAGMLHDIISLPKNHPNARKSSLLAAQRTEEILNEIKFPKELISEVAHAVHAHSFSAKVEPKTIEAMCVQDADRMEALGAFGLMRVFYCAGMFGSQLLHQEDPAAESRELNDKQFALDHFTQKLLTLQGTMKTAAGRRKAKSLSDFLAEYRAGLIDDHKSKNHESGRFKIARVYYQAGKRKRPLFNAEDPFAERGRELDPPKYPLDLLLKEDDPYIHQFLKQLNVELVTPSY